MATEVAASQAGRGRGEQEQALAGNLPFVVAVGAMRRMSNNINKPPYLAAARRQCKTTRRMRNFLVVIILRPSERASKRANFLALSTGLRHRKRRPLDGTGREQGRVEGRNGTQQLAKVFGRRLGFMRLNFTPYCIAGVPVGGLKTISDVFSYSALSPTLFGSLFRPGNPMLRRLSAFLLT